MKTLSSRWLVCGLAVLAQLALASAFSFSNVRQRQRRTCPLQVVGQGKSCPHQAIGGRRRSSSLHAVSAPEAPAKRDVKKESDVIDSDAEQEKERGWLVRLFNDPMNKREFVARCLMEICGLGDGQAYSVMMAAHQTGESRVVYRRLSRQRRRQSSLILAMFPAACRRVSDCKRSQRTR